MLRLSAVPAITLILMWKSLALDCRSDTQYYDTFILLVDKSLFLCSKMKSSLQSPASSPTRSLAVLLIMIPNWSLLEIEAPQIVYSDTSA